MAKEYEENCFQGLDEIERAKMIYVINTQSFNSAGKSFSKKDIADETYRKHIRSTLPLVRERLQNIRIFSMDGLEMIKEMKDKEEAFLFLDPPYRQELRGENARNVYKHEMSDDEQIRLLQTVRDARCKIMLCGYRNENGVDLYDCYLKDYNWHCYKIMDVAKSSQSKSGKKDVGHEYIWVNYGLPEVASAAIDATDVMQH